MKGGARCNNTSCVNTSEKNWLWWRVVREKGKWWRTEVMMKGSGEEGKWWWRGVVKKGSDDEGKWWRREVVKKGSGDEGKECCGLHGICGGRSHWNGCMMLHGLCVGEEAGARNIAFFRVKWLQATMKGTSCVRRLRLGSFCARIVPPMCFARSGCSCVRSSMRFFKLWLQILLEWLLHCRPLMLPRA